MLPLLLVLAGATPLELAFERMQADPKRETRYAFGKALLDAELPTAAYAYLAEMLHGPDDELKRKAIADLIAVAKLTYDDVVIPHSISAHDFGADDWARLRVGEVLRRKGDARASLMLSAIESKSEHYGKAQYLLALDEVKAQFVRGGDRIPTRRFDLIASWARDRREPELERLAKLAIARIHYSQGDMKESADAYRAFGVSDEVRLELGWALFHTQQFE